MKGVGPIRADLLRKELEVFTARDLLELFPYRHVDRTRIDPIGKLTTQHEYAQVVGKISVPELVGSNRQKRLTAYLQDASGTIELTWFQGINWVQKSIVPGMSYVVFGRLSFFMGRPQIVHPELELFQPGKMAVRDHLEPVYPSTEKLKARGLTSKTIAQTIRHLWSQLTFHDIPENIPENIRQKYKLITRFDAYRCLHFPPTTADYQQAIRRMKFEELFYAQLRRGLVRSERHRHSQGLSFERIGDLFNRFYNDHLPFPLTNAQKRVLKEIRRDTGSGKQMNRLLQGDVGSGKTIVALLSMLMAADNGFQSVLMAPTEILARQHFEGLRSLLEPMQVPLALLTGSTKGKERKDILAGIASGELKFIIGTHAVIEDKVVFQNLGLAVVDEQHKFGVAQRAKLWAKNHIPPHVLVMTATPIPRTLALSAYGDLDYSVIDELPPGRKPVKTVHYFESRRPSVMDFLRAEIAKGRQAYVVYPLIDESEKVDYENLMKGYEEVKSFFPEPKFYISMVHGKQPPEQKETNMARFVQGDTQIMVSTTVIEVGVNVPNASVMVIESAEKFGLSQLHQLRGRVGRGAEESFCILLTSPQLSNEARERMKIMCATNDGFKVAEKDLELRGPGDIDGTRQSGEMPFKVAHIVQDKAVLEIARQEVDALLDVDPDMALPINQPVRHYLSAIRFKTDWSKIG